MSEGNVYTIETENLKVDIETTAEVESNINSMAVDHLAGKAIEAIDHDVMHSGALYSSHQEAEVAMLDAVQGTLEPSREIADELLGLAANQYELSDIDRNELYAGILASEAVFEIYNRPEVQDMSLSVVTEYVNQEASNERAELDALNQEEGKSMIKGTTLDINGDTLTVLSEHEIEHYNTDVEMVNGGPVLYHNRNAALLVEFKGQKVELLFQVDSNTHDFHLYRDSLDGTPLGNLADEFDDELVDKLNGLAPHKDAGINPKVVLASEDVLRMQDPENEGSHQYYEGIEDEIKGFQAALNEAEDEYEAE